MYQPLKSGGWFPMGSRSRSREFHNTPRDIGSGGSYRRSCPRWCRRCRFRIFPQCRRDRLRRPAGRMRRLGHSSQRKRSCRERAQSYYPPIARGCGTIQRRRRTRQISGRFPYPPMRIYSFKSSFGVRPLSFLNSRYSAKDSVKTGMEI